MRRIILALCAVAWAVIPAEVQAVGNHANKVAVRHSRINSWHGPYYHTAYGYPIGLVVPPRASMQTKMQWGVSGTEMRPVYHQFYRAYPGESEPATMIFSPTPRWPSHTDQFGVYYIRGPW